MAKATELPNLGAVISASLTDILNSVVVNSTSEIDAKLGAFSDAWKYRYQRRTSISDMHLNAGLKAQQKIVSDYQSRFKSREYGDEDTRVNAPGRFKRYAEGAMLRALSSPDNVSADVNGVAIINTAVLDRTAKQWYRLNFGAGERGYGGGLKGASARKAFNIALFGQQVGNISLRGFAPSPSFEIPAGYFEGGGLGNRGYNFIPFAYKVKGYFTPKSFNKNGTRRVSAAGRRAAAKIKAEQATTKNWVVERGTTQGIAPANFFGEGVGVLVRELQKGWTDIIDSWFAEAAKSARSASAPAVKAGISRAAAKRYLS